MKTDIRDAAAVSSLRPPDVAAYLRTAGWTAQDTKPRWSIWIKDDFEALVPLDRTLTDFAPRMADILRVLEVSEDRSQLEIFNDLVTVSADIIRVRASESDNSDGTIPLGEGATIVERSIDLMAAAAMSTVSPKSYYRSRRSNEVNDYLQNLRLGQTEVGSFVLKIVSRVPPKLTTATLGAADVQDPFERKVTSTLFEGLGAARQAAQTAMTTNDFDAFSASVPNGVSANLCSAISAMGKSLGDTASLSFELSWAKTRPALVDVPRQVVFQRDFMPALREAATIFKERSPFDEFEVTGTVERLNRPDGSDIGTVVIPTEVEGRVRRVSIQLSGDDYDIAVRSHRDRIPLVCEGTLVKQGVSYTLQAPVNVHLLLEE
jgi:hypothetical protein